MDYLEEIWEGPEVLDPTAGLRPKSHSTHTHKQTHTRIQILANIHALWICELTTYDNSYVQTARITSVRTLNRHHLYMPLCVFLICVVPTLREKTITSSEVPLHHMQTHQWASMRGQRQHGDWSVFAIWLSSLLILKLREAPLVFSNISWRPKTLLETALPDRDKIL